MLSYFVKREMQHTSWRLPYYEPYIGIIHLNSLDHAII